MKKCPNCGHSVGDLEENCNRCGEALAVDPAAILAAMSRKKKKKEKADTFSVLASCSRFASRWVYGTPGV